METGSQIQGSQPETKEPKGSARETVRCVFQNYLLEVTPSTPPNSLGLEATRTFSGYRGNQEPGRLTWPGPLKRREGWASACWCLEGCGAVRNVASASAHRHWCWEVSLGREV